MKAYWSETRPNGHPVEPGTVCFITDLEDGTLPIPTYGKTQEEVLHKLALQNAHAQIEMVRRSARTATPSPSPAATPAPPARRIGPDQVMQATADLTNPAKAGEAVATLFEHQTGLNPQQMILHAFSALADRWEASHPEFFAHNGNRRMMVAEATHLAGGLGKVTESHLDNAFSNLRNRGELFEAPPAQNSTLPPSPPFPDENQVQRNERPRPRFATGARSTAFRSQAPARTPKYTELDIRTMPMSKARQLVESGDKDYAEACELYYGSSAQATA